MVIVREHNHISPHVVHDHREPLEHGINRLSGEMREILVLSPVGRKETSLNLSIPGMSILQLLPNPARQVLCLNPIKFGLTQSTVQVVDCPVVGVEHVPRSWSKEVHRMNISCVHHDIPQDLTLAAEERSHPSIGCQIRSWRGHDQAQRCTRQLSMIPTNKSESKHLRIEGTNRTRKSNENSLKKTRKSHELQEGNRRNHESFHLLGGQILYKRKNI
jgi:hypothetical protein